MNSENSNNFVNEINKIKGNHDKLTEINTINNNNIKKNGKKKRFYVLIFYNYEIDVINEFIINELKELFGVLKTLYIIKSDNEGIVFQGFILDKEISKQIQFEVKNNNISVEKLDGNINSFQKKRIEDLIFREITKLNDFVKKIDGLFVKYEKIEITKRENKDIDYLGILRDKNVNKDTIDVIEILFLKRKLIKKSLIKKEIIVQIKDTEDEEEDGDEEKK